MLTRELGCVAGSLPFRWKGGGRGGQFGCGGVGGVGPVPHFVVASMLGALRATVTLPADAFFVRPEASVTSTPMLFTPSLSGTLRLNLPCSSTFATASPTFTMEPGSVVPDTVVDVSFVFVDPSSPTFKNKLDGIARGAAGVPPAATFDSWPAPTSTVCPPADSFTEPVVVATANW